MKNTGRRPLPNYELKQPFWTPQQEECFALSYDKREFALFMEPRCGKSKPVVDTACYQYETKDSPLHINGVIIVAYPNGVHAGWIKDAFPENVPDRIPWKGFIWNSAKTKNKSYKADYVELARFQGLAVLAVNAEAVTSDTTKRAIDYFLRHRGRVALVADESSFMVTANAQRTKYMDWLSKRPEIRWKRILDGTPAGDNGPFDYFTQIRFLNRAILGITTNAEFKARYAEWEVKINHNTGRSYPKIKEDADGRPIFRNMDDLWRRLDPISYRATFAQCFNTPRKVYQKRYFELDPVQRRVYDELRDAQETELKGIKLSTPEAIVRMTRLQQIASNYFPETRVAALHDDCGGEGCDRCDGGVVITKTAPRQIAKVNPRLMALKEELRPGRQLIVWCKFRQDAADVAALAAAQGLRAIRYDGSTSADQKQEAKDGFQAGRYDMLIGNQRSAGRGIPLWKAYGHVYYSNAFSLRDRQQSEDRAEIAHRTVGTSVVDLIAIDTIDDQAIIPALRAKMDVATYVMRDPKRIWI